MSAQLLIAPEVSLPPTMPVQLPPPLFQLDQTLKFGKVPTGDFGRVVGYVFAAAASVQAIGFSGGDKRPIMLAVSGLELLTPVDKMCAYCE